jgi:hypothetical protein
VSRSRSLEGVPISCPAPDLTDGPYRVHRSDLRHLRAEDGERVGVLTKPSEGKGFLMTQRGHPVAKFQWSEAGCQMETMVSLKLHGVVVDPKGEPVADVEVVPSRGGVGVTASSGQAWLLYAGPSSISLCHLPRPLRPNPMRTTPTGCVSRETSSFDQGPAYAHRHRR